MRRLEEVVFWRDYVAACRSANHEPPKVFRGQIGRPTLELPRAEAFTIDEWKPLLTVLAKDNSLHYIAIGATSSRYKVLERLVFERDVREPGSRTPSLYSKYVMGLLASSLSSTLTSSKCLTSLFLSKIPIKGQYLTSLCKGIGKTKSLQHLAIHHCPVEDSGCDDLCKSLASRPTLTTLDLTDCALSDLAAEHLALLIKKQCCVRVSEVWKGSLRYGQPEGDDMPGLRRITLNLNPAMSDKGVKALISALQDDIWIKGVDMQGCGIGEEGACSVADLLEVNHCITVFDLRGNPKAAPVLPSLMTRLRSNLAYSKPGQFKCRWMEEVEPPSARVSQMTLNHGPLSSRGSIDGSERSFRTVQSNSSEPPWLASPKKPVALKKQAGKGLLEKTRSLEVGMHKLRFIGFDTPPASRQQHQNIPPTIMVSNENLTYNRDRDIAEDEAAAVVVEEEERRQPIVAVSKEQYEILTNFKKFTQSFVKTRDKEEESGVAVDEMRGNSEEVNHPPVDVGTGDCVSNQPPLSSQPLKPPFNKKPKRLDAGDAATAEGEEDNFKERTHQLLRKLIKLRNDRGLEKNEGVMRVCSQLSLPESKCMKEGGELAQPSASFVTLAALQKP